MSSEDPLFVILICGKAYSSKVLALAEKAKKLVVSFFNRQEKLELSVEIKTHTLPKLRR